MTEEKKDKIPLWKIMATLGAIGAAFWTGTLFQEVNNLKSKPQVAGEATEQAQPAEKKQIVLPDDLWEEVKQNGAAVLGEEGASATIVEFTDYQCPFCAKYSEDTFSQIKREYIDTGKIKYILRDLPLGFHKNAKQAALAARCAGDKYWAMHDKLFENQSEWAEGDGETEFKAYAVELGVTGFNQCFEANKFKAEIEADAALGAKAGVTGTPSFFVNGKKLEGAMPYSVFKKAIEAELK